MKIFIVDFSNSENIIHDLKELHNVEIYTEYTDGALAYKSVGIIMPNYVLINLDAKPTHGFETAKSIKQRKKTESIPLIFISNSKKNYDQIKEISEIMTMQEVLTKFKNELLK